MSMAEYLRDEADLAIVYAGMADLTENAARSSFHAAAVNLADAVLHRRPTPDLVSTYARARALWISTVENGEKSFDRARTLVEGARKAFLEEKNQTEGAAK